MDFRLIQHGQGIWETPRPLLHGWASLPPSPLLGSEMKGDLLRVLGLRAPQQQTHLVAVSIDRKDSLPKIGFGKKKKKRTHQLNSEGGNLFEKEILYVPGFESTSQEDDLLVQRAYVKIIIWPLLFAVSIGQLHTKERKENNCSRLGTKVQSNSCWSKVQRCSAPCTEHRIQFLSRCCGKTLDS